MTPFDVTLSIIDAQDWVRDFSESAHLMAFEKNKPAHFDRLDYAMLMARRDTDELIGYITCRELDHETVYWQFGGVVPSFRSTPSSLAGLEAALDFAKTLYKRVTLRVENDNVAMLKFAMKFGFKIIGLRHFKGTVLLEHMLEFTEGV